MLDTLLTGPLWARFSEKLECSVNEAAVCVEIVHFHGFNGRGRI